MNFLLLTDLLVSLMTHLGAGKIKFNLKLLQMFQTYDKKQFANVVAGDENRVYYFEPVRKVSNKISATKHSRRPIIVKRSLKCLKGLVCNFYSLVKELHKSVC